ncbi:MAG TPA: aldo/keto reductase [Burkholderiales bacterium]|nr:aldo/keto reductase [Burkholderiales bacterium]
MDWRRRALLGAAAGALLGGAQASRKQTEKRMTKRIPSTGEALPAIGLGTWQVFDVGNAAGPRKQLAEVLRILGSGMIDSSPMYGSSESVAGDLVSELGLRERFFMATKVWTSGRAEGIRQMEDSFRRLRVQKVDLLQVHNLVDVATHTKTLQAWKAEGRVRYIGITHYTASAHREVEKWLDTRQYDFVQINYSLGERDAEERLLDKAKDLKVAVIANRPFAEGSLFRKVKGKALPPWAAELGIASWAQYFLKWIVSHPAVTCTIPATSRPEHMRDNLQAGEGPMPDAAQRDRMARYLDSL